MGLFLVTLYIFSILFENQFIQHTISLALPFDMVTHIIIFLIQRMRKARHFVLRPPGILSPIFCPVNSCFFFNMMPAQKEIFK